MRKNCFSNQYYSQAKKQRPTIELKDYLYRKKGRQKGGGYFKIAQERFSLEITIFTSTNLKAF